MPAKNLRHLAQLIANDGHAASFQSLGQYRSALLKEIAQARAQLPTAGGAVPEGWMLVERSIWTEGQVESAAKSVEIVQGIPGATARDIAMAAMDAAQCKAPDVSLNDLMAAGEHPVSGEQIPPKLDDSQFVDEFMKWWEDEGQYVRSGGGDCERTFAFQAWRHLMPAVLAYRATAATPAAQDLSGLLDILERVRLSDDQQARHGAGFSYWNNAVIACQCAIRDANRAQAQGGDN